MKSKTAKRVIANAQWLNKEFRANEVDKALEALPKSDGVEKFKDEFGHLIGVFRLYEVADKTDQPKAAREYLEGLQKLAAKLSIELNQMPSSVASLLTDACYFSDSAHFGTMSDRITEDLNNLEIYLEEAKKGLQVQRGRPDSRRRDRLIAKVVDGLIKLGMDETSATKAAADCLIAAGVARPAERSEVGRIYRNTKMGRRKKEEKK